MMNGKCRGHDEHKARARVSNERKLWLCRDDLGPNTYYEPHCGNTPTKDGGEVWSFKTCLGRYGVRFFEALFPALKMKPGEGYELKVSPLAADGRGYFQSIRLGDPIAQPERTYSIGQRFKVGEDSDNISWLLVAAGPGRLVLVDTKTGINWFGAVSVGDVDHVSAAEITEALDGDDWSLIEEGS